MGKDSAQQLEAVLRTAPPPRPLSARTECWRVGAGRAVASWPARGARATRTALLAVAAALTAAAALVPAWSMIAPPGAPAGGIRTVPLLVAGTVSATVWAAFVAGRWSTALPLVLSLATGAGTLAGLFGGRPGLAGLVVLPSWGSFFGLAGTVLLVLVFWIDQRTGSRRRSLPRS